MAHGVPDHIEREVFERHVALHFATISPIEGNAEYQHYLDQLKRMRSRLEGEPHLFSIAMACAVMERLKEFEEWSALVFRRYGTDAERK